MVVDGRVVGVLLISNTDVNSTVTLVVKGTSGVHNLNEYIQDINSNEKETFLVQKY